MSLIGSLDQFDLANILRRIEVFAKTGLIVVKQQDLWVEFYFRQGQLVCIGPMRANATLIDRLLQANLLSFQALPQIMSVISATESNETRIAVALINEGYLSREILRAWAAHETSQVLQTIMTWPAGEIYFEDECPTPADRLLVALSISTLLDTLPAAPQTASTSAPTTDEPVYRASAQPAPGTPIPQQNTSMGQFDATQLIETAQPFASPQPRTQNVAPAASSTFNAAQLIEEFPTFTQQSPADKAEAPGMFSASDLFDDMPFNASGSLNAPAFADQNPSSAMASIFGAEVDISASTQSSLTPPQQVYNPLPPARIDTSFMTPDLILIPVDLSSLREQNPQVQLTTDQWRLFAMIDGQVSLQMLCQALMAPPDQVRGVAGELMAIGLVMPLAQATGTFNTFQTNGQPAINTGQYPSAPYAAAPIETQSQWGNGNTGATFMVGGGWMLSSKHQAQSGQPSSAYAPVGGYR